MGHFSGATSSLGVQVSTRFDLQYPVFCVLLAYFLDFCDVKLMCGRHDVAAACVWFSGQIVCALPSNPDLN